MYSNCLVLLCISTALFSQSSLATTVFRCTDTSGHVSFSSNGCLKGELIIHQDINNPRPSGDTVVTSRKLYSTDSLVQEHRETDQRELIVVGTKEAACQNALAGSEKRVAIIQKKIKTGMTRDDVESALGKPYRITQFNGNIRYHYEKTYGKGSKVITFDELGCVSGKPSRRKKATP
jgi:hypothetical protein